jgi:hypothetical protein
VGKRYNIEEETKGKHKAAHRFRFFLVVVFSQSGNKVQNGDNKSGIQKSSMKDQTPVSSCRNAVRSSTSVCHFVALHSPMSK